MAAAHAEKVQNRRDKDLIDHQTRNYWKPENLVDHAGTSEAFSKAATAASKAKSVEVCRAGYLATPDKMPSFANRPVGGGPSVFNTA